MQEDNNNQNNKDTQEQIASTVKGAIVGAGVTIIATQLLKDKKRVNSVKNALSEVKEKAMNELNSSDLKKDFKKIEKKSKKLKLLKNIQRAKDIRKSASK